MNCVCGCGKRLGRGQVDDNLLAAEVAVELLVWDKARTFGPPAAAGEVGPLLGRGAPLYQALLGAIHGDREVEEAKLGETREWLADSRAERHRLGDRLAVPKRKIKLSDEDEARIDRLHPERSFSGAATATETDPVLEALLVVALEDVRSGRPEEARRALRRFLAERS